MSQRIARDRYQLLVREVSRAELHLEVVHSWGRFVMPVTSPVSDLYRGVVNRWDGDAFERCGTAEVTIRVPLSVARAKGLV